MSDDDKFVLCNNDIAGEHVARVLDAWRKGLPEDVVLNLTADGQFVALFGLMHRELMDVLKFAGRKAEAQQVN